MWQVVNAQLGTRDFSLAERMWLLVSPEKAVPINHPESYRLSFFTLSPTFSSSSRINLLCRFGLLYKTHAGWGFICTYTIYCACLPCWSCCSCNSLYVVAGDTYTAVGNQNRAIEVDLTLKLQSMFLSCCSLRAYDLFICKALHTIILVDHTLTIKTSFFYNFLGLNCIHF